MKRTGETVVWPKPARIGTPELLSRLRRRLHGRVEEAYLIGSYATETADADSDVDLILVRATGDAWPERAREFHDLYDEFPDLDLLIYTPAEWARTRDNPSTFLDHARRTWKRIL
jgi:predicted nucleotidyltransferase